MASLNHIVLGFLILQIYVHAAPNDVSKLEEIAKVEQADPKLEQTDPKFEQADSKLEQTDLKLEQTDLKLEHTEPKLEQTDPTLEQADPKLDSEPKEVESDNNSTESQRHKRWYNPFNYGFPPFNPFTNPGFNKRDDGSNTGYYPEDPLAQIQRRVQEIAHFVRQPQQPPPPPHIPIFYPVIFIPSADCNCYNENQNPTGTQEPEPESPVTPGTNDGDNTDGTTPSIVSRWPPMDDDRQNWGIVVNETDSEEGVDFNRPISFDPIRLNKPIRPPPPVEHGTIQTDSNNQNRPQSEAPSFQTTPARPQPPTTWRPPQSRPQNSQPPRNRPTSGLPPPSSCDSAILACCHQPHIAYDCFASRGCRDLSGFGNPCDTDLILRVIDRYTKYYEQRYD